MEKQFIFKNNEGLYWDGTRISDFCPQVVKKIVYSGVDANITKNIFRINLRLLDGSVTDTKEVEDLSHISYFNLWGYPDSLLSREVKRLLLYKMQNEAKTIDTTTVIELTPGLQFYNNIPVYAFGDRIVGGDCEKDYHIKSGFAFPARITIDKTELLEQAKSYVQCIPGVTEVLFYDSLLAVLKPILFHMGYNPGFVLALIGPSGHLKTTLVRKYALWMANGGQQEKNFRDCFRIPDLFDLIDKMKGMNVLMDDLHESYGSQVRNRQNDTLNAIVRHVSTNGDCANVIVTGESIEGIKVFSCLDRLLQISISSMKPEQLKIAKERVNKLSPRIMIEVAFEFIKTLLENYSAVETFIKSFWEEKCSNDNVAYSCFRTGYHGTFILLTERLYCRFMCSEKPVISCRFELEKALSDNRVKQEKELELLRDKETDYLVALYEIVNDPNYKYLTPVTICENYQANGANFLVRDNKIYITNSALQRGLSQYLKKPVSLKKVSAALHDAGVIEEDEDARTKKYNKKRHYVISVDAFEWYYQLKTDNVIIGDEKRG